MDSQVEDASAEQFSTAAATHPTPTRSLPQDLSFTVAKYTDIEPTWPNEGRHILATFNDDSIVVYQAYNRAIAEHAVQHQTFSGCPSFSETRMTWIKTNFLWVMYRSNWGRQDPNQHHTLAITINRSGFEEILRHASEKEKESDVRLQWDPDHTPYGDKAHLRRAVQLGLRNQVLQRFLHEWIIRIDDISDFVEKQAQFVDAKRLDLLQVPAEKMYSITNNDELITHIRLD